MRYLITGITGFAGPHLANLLIADGHEVWGLSRASNGRETDILDIVPEKNFQEITFIHGHLEDRVSMDKLFKKHKFDGIFHLGAQSHPPTSFKDPMGTFAVNATGTINIVEAILEHQPNCKFMFCSTSEVYGAVAETRGFITEEFPIEPMNPYGVSKAAADLYVRERAISLNAPFFVTRAFSHTGPRRGKTFSISSDAYQIVKIMKGLQGPFIKVGTLSSKRVVMDIRDCVRAYYALMNHFQTGAAYNVGGDELFSMGQLLDKMLELSELTGKVEKIIDPSLVRPIDIPVQICDTTKLRSTTGWKPEIKIEQTLKDLLTYWYNKIK